ncbi:MAG: hypothetical protein ACFNZJ_01085 [Parascardovia denticolens]
MPVFRRRIRRSSPRLRDGEAFSPPIFHFVILFGGLSESFRQSFLF